MAERGLNRQSLFRGFSTVDAERSRSWKLYDLELAKRDLLNHFHTRIGERRGRPRWGCRIWEWLMDAHDQATRDAIRAEAVRICNEDTRFEVTDVIVSEREHGVRVEIWLNWRPERVATSFYIDFEARTEEM